MKTITAEPYLDIHCGLGEGPFWEENKNVLRFVDIMNKSIWYVDLTVGPSSARHHQYEYSIGVTCDLQGVEDKVLFGGKHGVGVADKHSSNYRYIQRFWTPEEVAKGNEERMRANDGAIDSQGRFWVSAFNDPSITKLEPVGVLFRLDTDGSFHRMVEGLTIPNGTSWSLDDKTMYFTDSGAQTIYAYDFDAATGNISNKRVFFRVEEEGCAPDGHTMDVEGNIWVAIWGGWKVVRVNPEGKVTAEIKVPTRCPTSAVIAGEDIYITSEADPEVDKYPESKRYSGGVFKAYVGIPGKRPYKARVPIGRK
ncbi:hypothetical protein DTO271G3_7898 [Paecilomyces variotii]|nr:hypothetical protein DTO271G3_7898 [Paecilomyces variotii]